MNQELENVTEQFRKLPGIGVKSARRLAYFMLERPESEVKAFLDTIKAAREKICYCSVCCNLATSDPCDICGDARRDHSVICVVEQPQDVMAMEQSHEYHGLYHVLHGALSPLDGISPDQLKIKELLNRLESDEVKEVILATDPDAEKAKPLPSTCQGSSNRPASKSPVSAAASLPAETSAMLTE